MLVFSPGERFCTLADNGEAVVWVVHPDGSVIVAPVGHEWDDFRAEHGFDR